MCRDAAPGTSARRAVCRSSAHDTSIQDGGGSVLRAETLSLAVQAAAPLSSIAVPNREELRPLPADKKPTKQPCCWPLPRAFWESVCCRARVPLFDERIKLSLASESTAVSLDWHE